MAEPFVKKTYYAMTLDPVHVGTGGYRLGRVDNTIVREPGTNIPKIPGSSISGAARAYTAMAVQSEDPSKEKYQKIIEIRKSDGTKEQKIYSCAGKGAEDGDGHCGRADCEVCVPFGFSKKGNSFQGLAQFYDARILFFPVHSMIGPVWVTSCSGLNDFQKSLERQSGVIFKCEPDLIIEDDTKVVTDLKVQNDKLNLGWLYLENSKKVKPVSSHNLKIESTIIDRIIVVSDKLFSQIVNDNLEVRTSVAIDPATGAPNQGIIHYEAIQGQRLCGLMWCITSLNFPNKWYAGNLFFVTYTT